MENSQLTPQQTTPIIPPIQTIPRSEVSKSNILRNTILATVWLLLVGSIVYFILGNNSISLPEITSIISNSNANPTSTTTPATSKLNPNLGKYSNQTFKFSIDLGGVFTPTECNRNTCITFPEQKIEITILDSKYLMSAQPENSLLTKSFSCEGSSEFINPTCSVLEVQELLTTSNIKGYLVIEEQSSTSVKGEQVFSENSHVILPLTEPITINGVTYNELQITSTVSNSTSELIEIAKTFKYE